MSGLTKHKLKFIPEKVDCSDTIGSFLLDGYGNAISSTDGYLNVNLAAPLEVNVDINAEYAEDSIHTSGDIGNFVLAVRNDNNTALTSNNGDYSAIAVDAYGHLIIDFASDLLNQDGYLQVIVTNPASEYAEDSGHTSGDLGTFSLGVRNDLNAVLTSNDLDYSAFAVDAYGRMKVLTTFDPSMLNADGYLNVNIAGPVVVNVDINAEYAEDSAHVSGDIGNFALAVRNDSNAVLTSNNGDYSPFAVDAYGRMKMAPSESLALVVDCPLPVAGVEGDKIDLGVDTYRRLYVNDAAHIGFAVTQNTIGLTAELLVPTALAGRGRLLVQNLGDCAIYIGASGVTSLDGFAVPGGATLVVEAGDCLALYAVAEEIGTDLRIMELA
jgi:hypothetical protein